MDGFDRNVPGRERREREREREKRERERGERERERERRNTEILFSKATAHLKGCKLNTLFNTMHTQYSSC